MNRKEETLINQAIDLFFITSINWSVKSKWVNEFSGTSRVSWLGKVVKIFYEI